jgi:Na+-transporting NADH:ubiquinone oxidoreductase subunit A
MIRIKRGLDLPISGAPEQVVGKCQPTRSVALLGRDYVGMKPTMAVKSGDRVKLGQPLFSDKKNPSVIYTAPGAGIVSAVNRGAKRRLLSVVIELDGDEEVQFNAYAPSALSGLTRSTIVSDLLQSGLWTALRTRPFSKVPKPELQPHSLFVNAMDTNPLAAHPDPIILEAIEPFIAGVNLLSKLPTHRLLLCSAPALAESFKAASFHGNVVLNQFRGPHPAGLTGTHIHFLEPAGPRKEIWSINYQDVIAIGKLFLTGRLHTDRVISLAGPQVEEPRLVRSRLGANLDELTAGELRAHESRVISGSVLAGDTARGVEAYLGRYHLQVSVLLEGRERPLLGYLSPGVNRHSVMGIYISSFYRTDRKLAMSTSTQGSERAMVPIGAYEKIMPLDILPTQLLRALIVGDIESAMNLGALELDEEDLALCSYVCPGKYEYGPILRDNLSRIEKEVLS